MRGGEGVVMIGETESMTRLFRDAMLCQLIATDAWPPALTRGWFFAMHPASATKPLSRIADNTCSHS